MHPSLDDLSQRFERFATQECRDVSPLYERIALGVAEDPEVLVIAARTQSGQPVPNALLAAVHALLLGGAAHPLADYYPSLAGDEARQGDSYPAFHDFCLAHEAEIVELIGTRLIQTNEVRRCACLLPAFGLAAEAEDGRPLALVEVGASAGLNLLWDRYGYDYGEGRVYGEAGSPARIACEVRGDRRPPIPASLPKIGWRLGIDLNPIDVRDAAATCWLRALVWPDQPERATLLAQAIELARADPPRLLAGDALELLSAALAEAPADLTLCVVHTHTLNQFSPEARARFDAILREASRARPLYRIAGEGIVGADFPELRLTAYRGGEADERRLARYEGHGEWIEWLDR